MIEDVILSLGDLIVRMHPSALDKKKIVISFLDGNNKCVGALYDDDIVTISNYVKVMKPDGG